MENNIKKINDVSFQHLKNTVENKNVLTWLKDAKLENIYLLHNFKNKKINFLQIHFLGAAFVLFLGIIGCSDVPYTGPVLTVDNVDRYMSSTGEDTVCLQDGFDTICLKKIEIEETPAPAPIIEIHPASVVFMFYYENRPILRTEKAMDTTELIQELRDSGRLQLPPDNNENNGYTSKDSGEWIIEIYYPEDFPETDRGTTPDTSGFDIRIGEGKELATDKKDDLEIQNFLQIDGPNGIPGVKFTIQSESKEITIHVNGLVPDYTAMFYIKADGVASEENIYTFQLQPINEP